MKKTLNFNDNLDERIVEYIKKYNMTYTSFVMIACEKFFDSLHLENTLKNMFLQVIENGKDIKKTAR